MDSVNLIRKKMLVSGRNFEIYVSGNSMEPIIYDGDRIVVTHFSDYMVGDVVVFVYDCNILVHRILKIKNNEVYCKGDNSFRLEQVFLSEIMGKVIAVNNEKIHSVPLKMIRLSYRVGKIFERNHSVEKTRHYLSYKIYIKCMKQLFGKRKH